MCLGHGCVLGTRVLKHGMSKRGVSEFVTLCGPSNRHKKPLNGSTLFLRCANGNQVLWCFAGSESLILDELSFIKQLLIDPKLKTN